MVLKQGPNKHIIRCHKIQNFQFEGKTNRMLISKGLLVMMCEGPPYPKFEFMFINHNVNKTFKW